MSVATLWEVAVRHALRPSAMPVGAATMLQFARAAGYTVLPVEAGDAVEVEGLPRIHSDPFDRCSWLRRAREGGSS